MLAAPFDPDIGEATEYPCGNATAESPIPKTGTRFAAVDFDQRYPLTRHGIYLDAAVALRVRKSSQTG
jgi:hypothetical protein